MGTTENKPVIFLAFANDRDDTVGYLRNLPDEARRVRDVLTSAEQAGLCDVEVRSNCTAADIFKVFQDPRFRNRIAIFHYGGHANGYQLLLESATGQAAAADAGGLATFLAEQQGLQLVFLNGCSTQQQTQDLLDANISAVISTSQSINDAVATDFACQFYQGLSGGATVSTAFNEAAAAARTAKGGDTRALYFGSDKEPQSRLEVDRWPWNLYMRDGSEHVELWNLPDAINDPLFGLSPLPELDLPESPYRNLNWFTRKYAEVFFGRGHQIRELYERLTAPRAAPIIMFYGQSGVGKSSILDAGLLPRLERDFEVRYLRRTESGLLDTLQLAFLPEASGLPVESAWRVKEEQTGKPLIVILDQVEEIYTRPIAALPNELDDLLKAIQATFAVSDQRPQGKLVLGFRKEWLAEVEAQMIQYELPRTKVFLERLDRRGIIEVVLGPTRSDRLREHYGLTVDEGLAEIVADDLLADRGSAISTTLQILLSKMWTKATEANYEQPRFSHDLYHDLQREGILLSDFLDQQLKAFHAQLPKPADSGLLLDVLAQHTTALGTSNQCSRDSLLEQYTHVSEDLPNLVQLSQDLYLLTEATTTQKEHTKTTRLAHDTLAPLVREQFDTSDKPGQRARRILDNRSVDWEDGRTGTPLDEADLKLVEIGADGTRGLSRDESRLVEVSRRALERRQQETQEQQRRLDQSRKQRTRAVIVGCSVAAILTVVSVGFGIWGKLNSDHANEEAQRARIRFLTAEANALKDVRPQRSLLLAARAVELSLEAGERPIPAAEQNLRELLSTLGGIALSAPHPELHFDYEIALSPDDRWLAAWSSKASPRIWDLHNIAHDTQPIVLPAHRGGVHQLEFTPDPRWLVTDGCADEEIVHGFAHSKAEPTHLWNLTASDPFSSPAHRLGAPINDDMLNVSGSKLSLNRRWLVTQNSKLVDGVPKPYWTLHDLSQSPPVERLFPSTAEIGEEYRLPSGWQIDPWDEPFGPISVDDQWMVLYGMTRAYLWNLNDGNIAALKEPKLTPESFFYARFSPNGRWLILAVSELGEPHLHFFSLQSDNFLEHFAGGYGDLNGFFSGTGNWLVDGGQLWDLSAADSGAKRFPLNGGPYEEFSADEALLGGNGHILPFTDRVPADSPIELPGASVADENPFRAKPSMSFSKDNRWLCTGNRDGTAQLWDISTIRDEKIRPQVLRGHTSAVEHVRFTHDGSRVITVADQTAVIWSTADFQPIRLVGHERAIGHVLLTSDDRWLITSGRDSIRLWDLKARNPAAAFVGHCIQSSTSAEVDDGEIDVAISPNSHWLVLVERRASKWNIRVADLTNPHLGSVGVPIPEPSPAGGDVHIEMDSGSRFCTIAFGENRKNRSESYSKAAYLLDLTDAPDRIGVTTLPNTHTKAAFSLDGKWLAGHSDDHKILVWKLNAEGLVGPPKPVAGTLMLFAEDNRTLLTAKQGKVLCWSLKNLDTDPDPIPLPPTTEIGELKLSKNGNWLAVLSDFGDNLHLWYKPLESNRRHAASYGDLRLEWLLFDPEGNWLAASGRWPDGTFVWKLNASASIDKYNLQWKGRTAFSDDAEWLVVGDRMWNLAPASFSVKPEVTFARPDFENSFSALAIGRGLIARGFSDGARDANVEIHLTHLDATKYLKEPVVLRTPKSGLANLLVSNDQRWLVQIEPSGDVTLWELNLHELVKNARLSAGRGFTLDEREMYSIKDTVRERAADVPSAAPHTPATQ